MRLISTIIFLFVSVTACAQQPNIVFIMLDDMGYGVPEYTGGESFETPVLDSLSAVGLQFSNAYATPACTPTRVEMMTGRYPFRTGYTGLIFWRPEEDQFLDTTIETPFSTLLQQAGYTTGVFGKWHLGNLELYPNHPVECGFDEYVLRTLHTGQGRQNAFWGTEVLDNGQVIRYTPEDYMQDIYTDRVIEFMGRVQEPFFAWLSLNLVHAPWVATPWTVGQGVHKYQSNPANFQDNLTYAEHLIKRTVEAIPPNTYVFIIGDNGTDFRITVTWNGYTYQGGKGSIKPHGSKVPFLVLGSNVGVVDQLVDFSDIFPTILSLANTSYQGTAKIDGNDFSSAVEGLPPGIEREWVYCQADTVIWKRFIRNTEDKIFYNRWYENDFLQENDLPISSLSWEMMFRVVKEGWKKMPDPLYGGPQD